MAGKSIMDRILEVGLGLAAYSEERVMEFLKDISARGETARKDVARIKKEFRVKGERFRKEFMKRLKKEIETSFKKMNLATAAEIAALKKRIEDLETKIRDRG